MLTETQLRQMLPLLPVARLQQYLPHLNEALQAFEIATRLRTAAFIAQTAHESAQYNRLLESLIYSKAAGLMATWPKRFPTEASALPYVRNEVSLANFVYADRMGNGDSASGDGFRYRGRGVIQLTGKANYMAAGQALGLDLVAEPELAQTPEVAFRIAGLYWKSNRLNELADRPDFEAITRRINGGLTGQADREKYYENARRVLADGFVADAPVTRGASRAAVVFMLPRDMPPLSRGWQDRPDDVGPAQPAAARKRAAGKTKAKKTSAAVPIAKNTSAKKAAKKVTAVKRAAATKAPPGKAVRRKAAAKRTAVRKTAAKKTASAKTAAKKTAARKVVAKTVVASKKAAGKRVPKLASSAKAASKERAAAEKSKTRKPAGPAGCGRK